MLRPERVVELRPFNSLVLLAVWHRDFYRAVAAAALIVRGREVHRIDPAIAGACPFSPQEDLVSRHRRVHCWIARPDPFTEGGQ